jgi:hypothetical protein
MVLFMSKDLNPDKALIFRITHRDNVRWIVENGLHCKRSEIVDPNFVSIGNPELICKRQYRSVDIPPGGTLSDYIPFYFTPFSPMMYNIKTGFAGITRRSNQEIVILVSSLHKVAAEGGSFVFSDRHAYLQTARFFADTADLNQIDWPILQARDFRRDPDDIGKVERYQAEALVRRHMPVSWLKGILCYNQAVKEGLDGLLGERDMNLKVVVAPRWYF